MFGRISYWHPYKSFGFLRSVTGEEYFVHRLDTAEGKALPEGANVEFELGQFKGRTCAKKVRPVEGVRDEVKQ